jgi:hypothetical protein
MYDHFSQYRCSSFLLQLYEVLWDGTDDSGAEKGPGVYFIPGLSFAAGRPLRLVRLP